MLQYLPLGSIICMQGASKKYLIIARALRVKNGDKEFFFDYGVVPYPDGLSGDQIAFIQHDAIDHVIFQGYTDSDDQNAVKSIHRYLKENPEILRGSPENWKG